MCGDQAVAHPVLGDVRHAQVRDLARRRTASTLSPPIVDLARVDGPQPDDRLDELGLAVALDAGDGDDLARRAPRATTSLTAMLEAVVADVDVLQA